LATAQFVTTYLTTPPTKKLQPILIACLVGWHDSSPVEIKKKLGHDL